MRFLVESLVTDDADAFDRACEHAHRVAQAGAGVRYVRTTFLPGSATALHLFDAPSRGALERAGRRAGLEFDRIVVATDDAPDRAERSNDEEH